ncbi:hypothetical protein C8J55DRAFT_497175 [Lentinula edodes]|uniref:Transmembrane protein n=1 Tax=Lentinula lateritia TaxID=40482 RepID=A0A9W9E0R1_9AGAR|nr:hypothetical protein C8J55DRAFT_497175 [Lentinula edodes]
MAFHDNRPDIEAEGNHDFEVIEGFQFTYNGKPRLIPRFRRMERGNTHHGTTYTNDFILPHTHVGITNNLPQTNSGTNRSSLSSTLSRLVQQCWLLLFLRLPALYHSRMLQVATSSGIGTADLHLLSTTFSALWRHELPPSLDAKNNVIAVSPHLVQFKASWELLVDDLLQEWKMFNLISALVQTSISVLLSLDGQAGSDPITRTGVLLSFICAGISLLCGSFCVLQFGSMRRMPEAAKWMKEAHKSDQLVWWNCWIMLAIPATWLAWSISLLMATIMLYTWRNTTQNGVSSTIELSAHAVLSLRITVSAVLAFGVVCIGALVITLSLQFGDHLDQDSVLRTFNNRDARSPKLEEYRHESEQPRTSPSVSFPVTTFHSRELPPLTSVGIPRTPFPTTKLMDANSIFPLSLRLPRYIQDQNQCFSPWDPFINELQNIFQHPSSLSAEDVAFACIQRWNMQVFGPNNMEAILCMEFPLESEVSDEGVYSVYIMDLAQASTDRKQRLVDIFGPLPASLRKVCLIEAISPSVSRRRGYPIGLMLEREPVPTDINAIPVQTQSRPSNRTSQAAQSTGRPIGTTHPTPQQGSRAHSAPQVVVNPRAHANTTDSHTRTRRTSSSQRTRRK